jgi:hypothetical protein
MLVVLVILPLVEIVATDKMMIRIRMVRDKARVRIKVTVMVSKVRMVRDRDKTVKVKDRIITDNSKVRMVKDRARDRMDRTITMVSIM